MRIAVIGVGHLGQHHARLLAAMPEVQLAGVVDLNQDRAREVAARYGTSVVSAPTQLLGIIDAVTIAAPTNVHVELAIPFVEAGIPVLVEKPLAATVAEADRLLAAGARRGTLIACGHTERFNPAVAAALPHIAAPKFVEIHRLGTFPDRSLDIDVIFDVMIHDLDLLLAILGHDVTSVEAVGVNVLTPRTDIANVRLRFGSGCIANLTASRISRERIRKARFFQRQSYVSIDYAAQEVEMYKLVPKNGRPAIEGGRLDVTNDEPLRRELADFVDAVIASRRPGVTGQDGRDALALATRIAGLM